MPRIVLNPYLIQPRPLFPALLQLAAFEPPLSLSHGLYPLPISETSARVFRQEVDTGRPPALRCALRHKAQVRPEADLKRHG